jgi:hypothetical protein
VNEDGPIEGKRERLQEAASNSAEELKDAVGELAAAAQTQANGVIETGRWDLPRCRSHRWVVRRLSRRAKGRTGEDLG